MAIKIALLKSGENVIADIRELIDENEKVLSLVFTNPYVVRLLTPQILFEGTESVESEHKVSFYPWIPLSRDKEMAVDPSWVVTIVEPQEMVKSSYESKMSGDIEGIYQSNNSSDIWSNVPVLDDEDQVEIQDIWKENSEHEMIIENFEVITEEKDG